MAITQIQLKRGLAANLPVLSVAEPAFTTDTKQFFIGTAEGNVRVALFSDVEAAIASAKAYTDSEINTLDQKIQGDIADAVVAAKETVVTASKHGLMAKEDKIILDRLVSKEVTWDGKETVEGAQAKADAALVAAKSHAQGLVNGLVDGAPEALDTIKELAEAITSLKEEDVNGLLTALAGKAEKVHTHEATDIIQDATHRFVTDAEKTAWNGKAEVAYVDNKVSDAKIEVEGQVTALSQRVQALEAVSVLDGGTF